MEITERKDIMCSIVEEYAAKRSAVEKKAAVLKANRSAILNGFKSGLIKEMAKKIYPKVSETMIENLYVESQKPARARKGQ